MTDIRHNGTINSDHGQKFKVAAGLHSTPVLQRR